MHTFAEKKLLMLKPDEIFPSPDQPRKTFDTYELKTLADSISVNGIIQPLTVRKSDSGKYILIAGERRLRAAKMAGLRRVPCVLHRTNETVAALYSLTENMQRADLNFFEEAVAIQKLMDNFGFTQSELAIRLGMATSTVSNKLRLLKLSTILQQRIIASALTERHARALLRLPSDMRDSALDKIIADGLNLSQAENYISNLLNPQTQIDTPCEESTKPIRKSAIGDIKLFSNSLSKLLCTMKNAGISAQSKKNETDKYIEYNVRIFKAQSQPKQYEQLELTKIG